MAEIRVLTDRILTHKFKINQKKNPEGRKMASIPEKKENYTIDNSAKLIPGLLIGKVALITGSSRGIGKGCAKVFAQHGCKVVINGRNPQVCEAVVKEILEMGGEAIACPANIMDKQEVVLMIQKIIDVYGNIDILVNNAGTSRDGLFHRLSDENFNFVIDMNLKGTHLVTQAVLPYFQAENRKDEYKKIINVASITGVTGNFGQSNYAVAKSAIIAYSKAIARELARDRINVNVIAPGFVETRMTQLKKPGDKLGMPEAIRNTYISSTPFARDGKAGQPHHVGKAILFFSSELSDWMSGQVMVVDGGMYI
jgi:3-oxoacyl-[acyl-carrier protein] reductase